MSRTIEVVYDGHALKPVEPVDLVPSARYWVTIQQSFVPHAELVVLFAFEGQADLLPRDVSIASPRFRMRAVQHSMDLRVESSDCFHSNFLFNHNR